MPPTEEELRKKYGMPEVGKKTPEKLFEETMEAEEAKEKTLRAKIGLPRVERGSSVEKSFREIDTRLGKLVEEQLQLETDLKDLHEQMAKESEDPKLQAQSRERIEEIEKLQAQRQEVNEKIEGVFTEIEEEWLKTPPKEKERKAVWEA